MVNTTLNIVKNCDSNIGFYYTVNEEVSLLIYKLPTRQAPPIEQKYERKKFMKKDIKKNTNEIEYTINDMAKTTSKGTFTKIEYLTFTRGYFLIVSKALIEHYGYKEALVLSELIRMCKTMPTIDEDRYCYITKSFIEKDIGVTKDVFDPIVKKLETDGAISTKSTNGGKKKWYKVNQDRLVNVFNHYNKRKKNFS